MHPRENLAVIGSGASAIYLLKHLLDESELFRHHLAGITIFEKSIITGMGMPYNPQTTDRYNMSNISSEELPELTISLADWLRAREPSVLQEFGLESAKISDSEVYSRLVLGRYLNTQYQSIIGLLSAAGIEVREFPGCEVVDISGDPQGNNVTLTTAEGALHQFDRVIVATGHCWTEEDKPASGYYASPWPIAKLLPEEGGHYDFTIGTLGASLSAFDVISSLAHRHGDFVHESGRMLFCPHPGTGNFKIVMHAAKGWLPHLQFNQEEPFREIYRHVDREDLLALVDGNGFLRIETYFDKVCRGVLVDAFRKDDMDELVRMLENPRFGLLDFIEKMTDEHDYPNAFEGMRVEMAEAEESVLNHKPIHWKEAIDDLMYTLNFHAELMPAEDHIFLHSKFMPFQMNVIAAMPLPSGHSILALYDAGKLDIVSGKVDIADRGDQDGMTTVTVDDDGEKRTIDYRIFVDCSGQKPLGLDEYPFPGLVGAGFVRGASAAFANPAEAAESLPEEKKERLFQDEGELRYSLGGVDIDSSYHLIGGDGAPNPKIHDIAFPHISGARPYSYGLQACSATTGILVRAWAEEIRSQP